MYHTPAASRWLWPSVWRHLSLLLLCQRSGVLYDANSLFTLSGLLGTCFPLHRYESRKAMLWVVEGVTWRCSCCRRVLALI